MSVLPIQQQAEHLGRLEYVLSKEADQKAQANIQAEQSLRLAQQRRRPRLQQQLSQLEGTLYSLLQHGVLEGEPLDHGWLVGEGNTRIFAGEKGNVQIALAGKLRGFSSIWKNPELIFLSFFYALVFAPITLIIGLLSSKWLGFTHVFMLLEGSSLAVPLLSWLTHGMASKWPALAWRMYDVLELPSKELEEVEALVETQLDDVREELSKRHLQLPAPSV